MFRLLPCGGGFRTTQTDVFFHDRALPKYQNPIFLLLPAKIKTLLKLYNALRVGGSGVQGSRPLKPYTTPHAFSRKAEHPQSPWRLCQPHRARLSCAGEFRVQGLGFRGLGPGFWVQGLGVLPVQGLGPGFRVQGFRGLGVQGQGLGFRGLGVCTQDLQGLFGVGLCSLYEYCI